MVTDGYFVEKESFNIQQPMGITELCTPYITWSKLEVLVVPQGAKALLCSQNGIIPSLKK